jgi:excisionase family DNA binding protein
VATGWTGSAVGDVAAAGGYLTVREVAERLRVCTATVYAMVKAGKLPHRRVSNMVRIPAAAVAMDGGEGMPELKGRENGGT